MWWKTIANWLRDKVDVDVALDLGKGTVALSLTVRLNEAMLLAERFEWNLPAPGESVRLDGKRARRHTIGG